MPDSDDDWKEFDKDKEAFVRKLRAAWRSDPRDLDAKAKYRRFKSIPDKGRRLEHAGGRGHEAVEQVARQPSAQEADAAGAEIPAGNGRARIV